MVVVTGVSLGQTGRKLGSSLQKEQADSMAWLGCTPGPARQLGRGALWLRLSTEHAPRQAMILKEAGGAAVKLALAAEQGARLVGGRLSRQ